MSKDNKKLTAKQSEFVFHYTNQGSDSYLNATQAATLAGYKGNTTTLAQVGAENLIKPYVKEAIEEKLSEHRAKHEVTAQIVINELFENAMIARKLNKIGDSNQALIKLGEHLSLFKSDSGASVNITMDSKPITEEQELKNYERLLKLKQIGNAIVDA